MKVLFLINGSPGSAAAERARSFAERLPAEWQIRHAYRPARKWRGVVPFVRMTLRFRPQIIHVVDVAYTGVIAGSIAKALLGCRLVMDTGDVAYELAKSTGNYSRVQLVMINATEQLALNYSDAVIVRGSYHQDLLRSQGVRRVIFVPDGVDVETVRAVDASELRRALCLKDDFVVGLVGTMQWSEKYQMCYGWDIIEALALLQEVPVKALLVGDGDGRSFLEGRAKALGVEHRVIFAGRLPFERLPEYLSAMDVCISTQSNDQVGMVRTTGKLPLYLACGRYVIATDVGEAKKVLPQVGQLLPYEGVKDNGYPTRLAHHIKLLVVEPERMRSLQQAHQIAAEYFNYCVLSKRLESLYREVADVQPEQ